MADTLNPLGFAMCRPTWTIGTKIWMCCRQVIYQRTSALQTTDDVAQAFDEAYMSLIVPLLHEDAVYEGTWCHRVFPGPLSTDLGFHQGAHATMRSGELLPLQCTALLRMRPPAASKRRPAHLYLSGLSADDVEDGVLSAAWLADAAALVAALPVQHAVLTDTVPANLLIRMCCPLSLPLPITFFESAEASAQLSTQRRRGDNGKATSMPYFPEQVFP